MYFYKKIFLSSICKRSEQNIYRKILHKMFTFLALLEMQNLYKQYPDFMRLISQMGIPTIFFLWSNFLFDISINIRSVKIIWNAHYWDARNQSGGPLSRTWLDESSVRKSCKVDDSPPVKTSLLFTVPHPEITLTRHRGRSIPGTSVRSAGIAM